MSKDPYRLATLAINRPLAGVFVWRLFPKPGPRWGAASTQDFGPAHERPLVGRVAGGLPLAFSDALRAAERANIVITAFDAGLGLSVREAGRLRQLLGLVPGQAEQCGPEASAENDPLAATMEA